MIQSIAKDEPFVLSVEALRNFHAQVVRAHEALEAMKTDKMNFSLICSEEKYFPSMKFICDDRAC